MDIPPIYFEKCEFLTTVLHYLKKAIELELRIQDE